MVLGFGQLTSLGVKQMIEFGDFFKSYYKDLQFEQSKVFARSTDYERTILSTYSFMRGLFGKNSIPVYTNPRKLDKVRLFFKSK